MEQLAGRLKWGRTESGIRVEFPAVWSLKAMTGLMRTSWRSLIAAVLLGFLICNVLQLIFVPRGHEPWWATPLCLAVGMAMGDFVANTPRRWIMILDRDCLWLEQRRFSWEKKRQEFSTEQLRRFRFVKSQPDGDIRNPYRLDEIQFDKNLATQYMVPGVSREEADALIAQMRAVYSFPDHPASEAVAAN